MFAFTDNPTGKILGKWCRIAGLCWLMLLGTAMQAASQNTEQLNPAHLIESLWGSTVEAYQAGHLDEATSSARRALEAAEQYAPKEHEWVIAKSLSNLAFILHERDQFDEAAELYRRELVIRERVPGDNASDLISTLNSLGRLQLETNHLDEAEALFRRALSSTMDNFPHDGLEVAWILDGLVVVLRRKNLLEEAERLGRRVVKIRTVHLPPHHPDQTTGKTNLAAVLLDRGNPQEAETLFLGVVKLWEEHWPERQLDIAVGLSNLGLALESQAKFAEALSAYRRALAIREVAATGDDVDLGYLLSNLGSVLLSMNELDEAADHAHRSLTVFQRTLPPGHPQLAIAISNLAGIIVGQGRFEDAEKLYRRALAMQDEALPAHHPDLAMAHSNLAYALAEIGEPEQAVVHHRQAVAIAEKAFSADHPKLAFYLSNLAALLGKAGIYAEAEQLDRRALEIRERVLPAFHPDVAYSHMNLGSNAYRQGQLEKGEYHYASALAIRSKAYPENHPEIAFLLHSIGFAAIKQGQPERALRSWEEATAIYTAPENSSLAPDNGWRVQAKGRLDAAQALYERDGAEALDIVIEARRAAFLDMQREQAGTVGNAIAAAMARAQAENPDVGALARERDQLIQHIAEIDAAFIAVSTADSDTSSDSPDALRQLGGQTREQLATLDERIAEQFPAYHELAANPPVAVEDLQPLLKQDEVLVSVTGYADEGIVYAYTSETGRLAVLSSQPDADSIEVLAAYLRCSAAWELDPDCVAYLSASTDAEHADDGDKTRGADSLGSNPRKLGEYNLDLGYYLYRRIFPKSIRELIAGKKLIIAPSPELLNLPWHLLVTQPPPENWNATSASRMNAYRQASWLFLSQKSITVLPAIGSLRALRSAATVRNTAERPFLGIGDPIIGASPANTEPTIQDCGPTQDRIETLVSLEQTALPRAVPAMPASLFAGDRDDQGFGLANPDIVRGLPRLADTRCELTAVAHSLQEEQQDAMLLLGENATEARVKALDESGELSQFRVVHFATHGLLGGELGLGEPGLILTPPQTASARDDGVLTASEISALNLNADWIVLSACNTAAGGSNGAVALSGLARSFFYAGASSLLVSSWPVYSPAATAITTEAFDAIKQLPEVGRAEALTIAMRRVLANAQTEFSAHPQYWGAFLLVGEGQ